MQKTKLTFDLPVSYSLELQEPQQKSLLVLHGFADRADAARKRLLGTEPVKNFTVLAPNGFFPHPVKRGDSFREAYAWYFRDFDTGMEMISPDLSARQLLLLLEKLGLANRDWTILAFSQGGFFAPHLVRAGLDCKKIISVGASYRRDAYEGLPALSVHAIHGVQDEIVNHDQAKASFLEIQSLGYGVEFHSLSDLDHTLNDEGRALVQKLL